ncbi:matrixin family metalloprotease [Oceanospirillum sediminis]|uniref:Matrixin family metalloprotease n=1 Tax=Oceanospirillum sediminis TaxID=2760088 RepID=A0A839IL91_9GAMM|nr:matrixin family metalloprotease [Oceanospirillum sediminis]MBB1485312.1 matrixin family metalloprotease [Oceanospirillum sediminis]
MSNETYIVQRGIAGRGDGNDVYVLSAHLIDSNASIMITDTLGSNSIQLIGGLSITSSKIASNTLLLELSNGASVTVLDAESMNYIIGGDPVIGLHGVDKTFSTFTNDILGQTVPVSGLVNGGAAEINSNGTAVVTPPEDTDSHESSDFLVQAQAKSNTNSGTGTVPVTGDSPALESGDYWSGSTITYSYNTTEPADYASQNLSGFIAFPDAAKTPVVEAFNDIETFTALTFNPVSVDGDIEFNAVEQSGSTDGFAFYPGSGIGGDVFLNNDYTTTEQYAAGGSPYFTLIHEVGHAMGLKHSFEDGATLPADEENTSHSVMSYTNVYDSSIEFTLVGNSINSQQVRDHNTTGYSLYDVMALQAAYGVNSTHNNTDTTYTVKFGTTVQEVLWDAGGTDLIDASQATGVCTVDLREQTFSSIDVKDAATQAAEKITEMGITSQTFIDFINQQYTNIDNQNELYTGEMNLAISKGVIIENVTTGSGNDRVQDNSVDNTINTGAGNDTILLTEGGFDTVDGGTGTDTVQLNIASSAAQVEKQNDGSYVVLADNFAAQLTGVENLQFTDTTTTLV